MSNADLIRRLRKWSPAMRAHEGYDGPLSEMIDEAADALAAHEWSTDMDAAPRDGTPVLFGGRWKSTPDGVHAGGEWHQQIFRWSTFSSSSNPSESVDFNWYSDAMLGYRPDHWNVDWQCWQFLPAPPDNRTGKE